jgi:hypothetical protein
MAGPPGPTRLWHSRSMAVRRTQSMGATVVLAAGLFLSVVAAVTVAGFVRDPRSAWWIALLSLVPWGPILLLLWHAQRRAERLVARLRDGGTRSSATVDAISGTPWTVNERPTVRLDLTVTPPDGGPPYQTWTVTAPLPQSAALLRPGVTHPVLIDPTQPERVLVDWEGRPGTLPDLAVRLAVIGPSWPRLQSRSSNWGWLLLALGLVLTAVKALAVVWSIVAQPVPPPLLLAGAVTAWFGPIVALVGILLLLTRRRSDRRRRRVDRQLRAGRPARATVTGVRVSRWRGTRDGVTVRRIRLSVRHPEESAADVEIFDAPPYHLEKLLVDGADLPVRLDSASGAEPLIDWPALEAETAEPAPR